MRTFVLILVAAAAFAQDAGWVRMWTEAQRARPAEIRSSARIAPDGEPGIPLVIRGRVFDEKGKAPLANVVVFAYQTDRTGVYNARGVDGWRLRGWARTDAQGWFTFRTIRPGSYPQGRTPAHVHFTIEGPGAPRQWTEDLRFAGDPFLSAREARTAGDPFGGVRPVTVRDGIQHVEIRLRVDPSSRF